MLCKAFDKMYCPKRLTCKARNPVDSIDIDRIYDVKLDEQICKSIDKCVFLSDSEMIASPVSKSYF